MSASERSSGRRRALSAAGLALCLGLTLPAAAAGPAPGDVPGDASSAAPEAAPASPQAERLVRLIVDLDVAVPSRAEMGRPEVMLAYMQAVQAAQSELLKSLSGHRVKNVRRYRTLPLVALETEPEVVELLLASPLVRSLRADRENEVRPEPQ